jgi:hypothetical protein
MKAGKLNGRTDLVATNVRTAKARWPHISKEQLLGLKKLTSSLALTIRNKELLLVGDNWYVSHSGLLKIAHRRHCSGIHTAPTLKACDSANSRWVFRATVFKSPKCQGFSGYGDADPSNVSPLVRGAEMRVAETRAVNRALRKAYGIGICSVEEIGSFDRSVAPERPVRKLPPKSANGNCSNGHGSNGNANGNGTRVRDRLCQLIRQHKLDAELVKAYAVDFCGTKTLREASREQVENFVIHLGDWAGKDRNALLCQLNSFQRPQDAVTGPQAGAA